jgi:hypothetical protein
LLRSRRSIKRRRRGGDEVVTDRSGVRNSNPIAAPG